MTYNQTIFNQQGTVYRPPRHGTGIWNNPRVPMTIRIDAKLKTRLKSYLIAKFGSTCRGIETIGAALLKAEEIQQHQTVYRPLTTINFEKVLIERNIRPRRKIGVLIDEEMEETVTVSQGCQYPECDERAEYLVVPKATYAQKSFNCDEHYRYNLDHGLLRSAKKLCDTRVRL